VSTYLLASERLIAWHARHWRYQLTVATVRKVDFGNCRLAKFHQSSRVDSTHLQLKYNSSRPSFPCVLDCPQCPSSLLGLEELSLALRHRHRVRDCTLSSPAPLLERRPRFLDVDRLLQRQSTIRSPSSEIPTKWMFALSEVDQLGSVLLSGSSSSSRNTEGRSESWFWKRAPKSVSIVIPITRSQSKMSRLTHPIWSCH